MPLCDYGAACTRRGCVYRHPQKTKNPHHVANEPHLDDDRPVCMPFLADACAFGARCNHYHPPHAEAVALRNRYALRACEWGDACRTSFCLFRHPKSRLAAACPPAAADDGESLPRAEPPTAEPITTVRCDAAATVAHAAAPAPAFGADWAAVASAAGAIKAALPSERSRPAHGMNAKRRVRMPPGLWLEEVARAPAAAFAIADPLARFVEVNRPHERRGAAVPLSVSTCAGSAAVLDLHFQSVRSVAVVLEKLLEPALARHAEAWLLTGSGHHSDSASHQRVVAGGVLHGAVREWLDWWGYSYHEGADARGFSGSFLVLRWQ